MRGRCCSSSLDAGRGRLSLAGVGSPSIGRSRDASGGACFGLVGSNVGLAGLYTYDGLMGLYDGLLGLYDGLPGLDVGLLVLYDGLMGLYDGLEGRVS